MNVMRTGMCILISIVAIALSYSWCIAASDTTNGLSISVFHPTGGDHSVVKIRLCNQERMPITVVTNDIGPVIASNAGGRLVCVFFEPRLNPSSWDLRHYAPVTLHWNECTEIFFRFTADLSPSQFQSLFPGISATSNANVCLVGYRIGEDFAETYGVWHGEIQAGSKPFALQPLPPSFAR